MTLRNIVISLGCLAAFLASGCDESDDKKVKLPSNLQITVELNPTDPKQVAVTATAQDVAYYNFYFGDVSPESPVESLDGTESHTYTSSGTFTIRVNAHATLNDFVTATAEITVDLGVPDDGYISPVTREGFDLVWEEDFLGSSLNTTTWNYEIGTGSNGWGNNELQYYRQENTSVSGGYLTITAKQESFSGRNYTSSRLTTKDKKDFTYGRFDIRAKLPKGQGIWPAIWMLGDNISEVSWPACGEIDIMEMIGGNNREATVHGTVHWADASNNHAQYGGSKAIAQGIYPDKFHVYSIEWNETHIKWFIDDVFFHQIDITPAHLSEFHAPQFFILNVAVGGNWPGSPDASTVFPQQMIVDYIRVFQ